MLLSLKRAVKLLVLCIISLPFAWSNLAYGDSGSFIEKRIDPVPFFVDRENCVKEIAENLSSHKIVSLIGVTNIGKTELARKYALLNKEKYDLIWFFDANLDLNEQFIYLAKKINSTILSKVGNPLSEEADRAMTEVMQFLTERGNWLLVFDNLKLGQNKKLASIMNWGHNGHIIICSQDSKNLPNNIYIHKLDKANSMRLIQEVLGNEGSPLNKELLENLADIFKGYTGLIVQGALLFKDHKYLSIDEYQLLPVFSR